MHFVDNLRFYKSRLSKTSLSHQELCIGLAAACLLSILEHSQAADIHVHIDIIG
jgi:hypothetical protein